MKYSTYFILIIIFFLIACASQEGKGDYSTLNGIIKEIIQAYNRNDHERVIELANQSFQDDEDGTIPLFYAALTCFAEGRDERGIMWFFLALDNYFKASEKNINIISTIIPAYRELVPGGSKGVATALWFLYMSVKNERKAEKIFPWSDVSLVDQAMVVRGGEITKNLCKYISMFCAEYKDQKKANLFIDVLKARNNKFNSVEKFEKTLKIKEIITSNEIEETQFNKIINSFNFNNWELADIFYDIAFSLYSEKKFSMAEFSYLKALEISKSFPPEGRHPDYIKILRELALLNITMNNFDKAEFYYLKALGICKSFSPEGRHPDYIKILRKLASLNITMNNFNKARAYLLQILEKRKAIPRADRQRDYADTLKTLALLYLVMNDYNSAEFYGLQALAINKTYPPEGKNLVYADTLEILGRIYLNMGNYTKAETLYLQAGDIFKALPPKGKRLEYIDNLSHLAIVYKTLGNYNKAESYCLQAMDILKKEYPKVKDQNFAILLNHLAVVYDSMGNYQQSENLHLKAMEIWKSLSPEGIQTGYAQTLHNLASLYTTIGNYNKAETYFLQSLDIRKTFPHEIKDPAISNTLNSLGLLYQKSKKYGKAESAYLQALEIRKSLPPQGKNPDYVASLHKMASLYDCMDLHQRAESFIIQSLSLSRELIRSNFIALSEKEREKYIATLTPRFEHFYSFLEKRFTANPSFAGTAANIRLFQKAIIFNSIKTLRECIQQSGDQKLIDTFNSWLILRRQINKACELTGEQRTNKSINLAAWEEDANKLEKTLSSESEDFRLAHEQKEPTWEDIRAALKPGEAAVELIRYPVYEKQWTDRIHYAAIIIKPDSKHPEIIFLKNGNTLEGEIINLYKHFMEETANNLFAQADNNTYKKLYTHLWQPIVSQLRGGKKIYFSPDGVYHFINPCTIKDATGTWLGEKWEITRITSLQDIVEQKQSGEEAARPPVLVGYPIYDLDAETYKLTVKKHTRDTTTPEYEPVTYRQADAFKLLPGSKEEVEAITWLFQKKDETPEVWLGEDALEECIKSVKNPRVLHIATHAFFQEDVPPKKDEPRLMGIDPVRMAEDPLLRSGLLFTGANRVLSGKEPLEGLENGILTAREAVDLNLDNTELVVLSACDTGLGEIRNGEGVYGLQRAFLVAGADAVLMSLWKVNDEATRDFMTGFYSAWLSGMSKREAYEKAVAGMKEKYPAPFYWGAFVMIGK